MTAGDASDTSPPATVWARIKAHKVLQWSLAYLGAALAVAHGQEILGHTYHWPYVVERILIGGLIVGLPIAIALAWYHGHRGLTRVSSGELRVVSTLLVVGAGLLILLVRSPEDRSADSASGVGARAPPIASSAPASAQGSIAAASSKASRVNRKPRLAILPFDNLSPDPANAFFADGLHEDVISTLATRAPGLEVISRTTMMLYRAAPKSIAVVAKELGATHVIEGSVRREGHHVRLTLQLIDGATDNHLWAQTYDRTLEDALSLQTDVAQQVVSQLATELSVRAPRALSGDPEAYDLYLKARLARQELNPYSPTLLADAQHMTDLLEGAVKLDPNFGLARLDFGNHLAQLYVLTGDVETLRRAKEQLDAAEELVPGNPVLIVTRAYYDYVTRPGAQLGPAAADALRGPTQDTVNLQVGQVLLDAAGRFSESLELAERWSRLDPGNVMVLDIHAWELSSARRIQEALHVFDFMNSRAAEGFATGRARLLFAYTGRIEPLRAALDRQMPSLREGYPLLWFEWDALRFEHRYADLERVLDQAKIRELVFPPDNFAFAVASPIPLAEFRGWAALLARDAAAAHRASSELRDFLTRTRPSSLSSWYRATLSAEAHLLVGNSSAAIAGAHESMTVRPRSYDALQWREVAMRSARVLAWAGAKDEAVELLEGLSTGENGLGPAEITRDPLYTVPLAEHPRFQQLVARLEAQMRETKLQ